MLTVRTPRSAAHILVALVFSVFFVPHGNAQAALLMEEPYGFFGRLNPTGHDAIYFSHICAETPVKLRRCGTGEMGSVIARYSDISGYDWVAIPLLPYLYSVEDANQVRERVDRATVNRLRNEYHEAHLLSLGENLRKGGFLHGGWSELVGVSYERRMYAYRFDTTQEQDDSFIAVMNRSSNRSHFQLLFNNCADFSRRVLDVYFPGTFHRSAFPDAGMTTPKELTSRLVNYAKKHPEVGLQVYEIPQVPGYRRPSHRNKSISESLITTGYAIPIVIINPYLAGGLFVDFLTHRSSGFIPKDRRKLAPETLAELTRSGSPEENPVSARVQVRSAPLSGSEETLSDSPTNPALKEIMASHE
jgi:hypothetical protein